MLTCSGQQHSGLRNIFAHCRRVFARLQRRGVDGHPMQGQDLFRYFHGFPDCFWTPPDPSANHLTTSNRRYRMNADQQGKQRTLTSRSNRTENRDGAMTCFGRNRYISDGRKWILCVPQPGNFRENLASKNTNFGAEDWVTSILLFAISIRIRVLYIHWVQGAGINHAANFKVSR